MWENPVTTGQFAVYVLPSVMAEADSVVSEECIKELLEFCSKGSFKAKNVDRRVRTTDYINIHVAS